MFSVLIVLILSKERAEMDEVQFAVAQCRICLLASFMKDCQKCKFNVGLDYGSRFIVSGGEVLEVEASSVPENKNEIIF